MNKTLTLLFILFTTTVFAQKKVDTLNFCSMKIPVPAGCKAESEYQVQCDNYTMVWLYMNEEMLKAKVPEQFIDQMKDQVKQFKKEPTIAFVLNKEFKAYKISLKDENNISRYQIVAYGIANGQPVLVQLSLNSEPKTNADIPEFPRQIVKLTN